MAVWFRGLRSCHSASLQPWARRLAGDHRDDTLRNSPTTCRSRWLITRRTPWRDLFWCDLCV